MATSSVTLQGFLEKAKKFKEQEMVEQPAAANQAQPEVAAPAQTAAPAQAGNAILGGFLAKLNQPPPEPQVPSDVSAGESYLRGAAQSATFNLGDELSGAFEAAFGSLETLVKGKNAFGDEGRLTAITNVLDNYRRARDTLRQQNEEARLANPKAYFAGEMTGLAVTAPAIGGGIAKGVQAIARGAQAVKATTTTGKILNTLARTGYLGEAGAQASLAQKTIAAGKVAAAEGALLGYGGSEAELTPDKMTLESVGQAAGDVAASTAISTGFGLATPVAVAGLAKAAQSEIMQSAKKAVVNALDGAANRVAETAGNLALRVIKPFGGNLQEIKKIVGADRIAKMGEELLNESVTPAGEKLKKAVGMKGLVAARDIIDENLTTVNNEVDTLMKSFETSRAEAIKKGMTEKAADSLYRIDKEEFINQAKQFVNAEYKTSKLQPVKKKLLGELEEFKNLYQGEKFSVSDALAERQSFQQAVKYSKAQLDPAEYAYNKFSGILNDMMDSKADQIVKITAPEKSGMYKKLRDLQRTFTESLKIADNQVSKKQANNVFSLTEKMTGIGTMAGEIAQGRGTIESAIKGALITGAVKAVGNVLPVAGAKAANTIVKGLRRASTAELGQYANVLKEASKRGVPGILATHLLLFSTDPEYKRQIQELDDVE